MRQRIYNLIAWLALGMAVFGGQPLDMLGLDSNQRINRSTKFGTGRTLTLESGATLALNGAISGTVTGGTLSLAAVTLTAGAINGLSISAQTGTHFFISTGKTFNVSNSITLAGTDSTTLTFQGTDTYVGRATTDTLTNKSISGSTNSVTNISLTGGVAGILPVANGGTGVALLASFSATKSTNQGSIADSTNTKVTFATVDWDNDSAFATNKYTPKRAGIWRVNVASSWDATGAWSYLVFLYKNGTMYRLLAQNNQSNVVQGSILVPVNGSTDYLEVYVAHNSGSDRTLQATGTYVQGEWVSP